MLSGFMSFYCFFFIVHLRNISLYVQWNWSHENKEVLTSLQKDFGMRQGGLQELLSTGGLIAGQPPAGRDHTVRT